MRVLDDTEMVAYMHYVLVDPEYQGHGLTGHLVGMVKERYRDYFYIEVMPEESKNAAAASIVMPTILLILPNDGGVAFSSIHQYIGGLAGVFGHFVPSMWSFSGKVCHI